jgi:hypothetical protein
MKNILILASVLALSLNAFAGCGKIETTEGKLKSFNAETKVLVVEAKDGSSKNITLTAGAKGADKADKLVGKDVKVSTSHGKVQSIEKA